MGKLPGKDSNQLQQLLRRTIEQMRVALELREPSPITITAGRGSFESQRCGAFRKSCTLCELL